MKDNNQAVWIVGIVALFAFLSVAVVSNGGYQNQNHASISITASGAAYALPDRIVITMNLNGTGATPAEATANLSSYSTQLNKTLQTFVAGNESNLQTTSYLLQKMVNSTYYVATEGIQATIPAGSVSDALLQIAQLQNVQISGVQSTLSKAQTATLMKQALSSALANATAQAEILAGGAPLKIGNLSTYSFIYYPRFSAASANGGSVPVFYNSQSAVVEQISAQFYRT